MIKAQIPRTEYPRPQFVRDSFLCLNGEWEFEFDFGVTGKERKMFENGEFSNKITVPFCPESKLSGIEYKDFMNCVWYRRKVTLEKEFYENRRVFINFGAVDYKATLYINGKYVGEHFGGFSSFSFEITDYISDGENVFVVSAEDDSRDPRIPSGKQSRIFHSVGCDYTRTTGIWQTVWLESTPKDYIKSVKITPSYSAKSVKITADVNAEKTSEMTAEVFFDNEKIAEKTVPVIWNTADFYIETDNPHAWSFTDPALYDVVFTLGDDRVESYFGLRDIEFSNGKLYINEEPVFQRLILDQGFYPDGIYTAPDDTELINDILRSKAMGFNGARLHQKVFEERFLYHCDRLGYIVWGEHANWGLDLSLPDAYEGFLPEWLEIIKRDYNHPSIIGWCPLNETQADINPRFVKHLYDMTKAYDPTRLFIDNSGWRHIEGCFDIYDVHDYLGDPEKFREKYLRLTKGEKIECATEWNALPELVKTVARDDVTFVSEFGGIGFSLDGSAWSYGDIPTSTAEFAEKYKGLVDALLDNPKISAFCYTQLTDVEQEQNGLYTYERQPKIDPEIIREINSRKAVIEDGCPPCPKK